MNDRIVPVKIEDIAYFYSEEKSNFLCTFDGKKYIVDSSLDIIAGELQPKTFFRISNHPVYAGGRLLIVSEPAADFEMTVSRSRVDDFMVWIAQ